MMSRISIIAAMLLSTSAVTAGATTINFSALADGTAVTTQFPGLTVSLVGGTDTGPAIVGDVFGGGLALGNSVSNFYPTAYSVNFAFSGPVSNLSFKFNNFGSENGSNYVASGSSGVISTALVDSFNSYSSVFVTGNGITNLSINNNNNDSWLFGIGSITFSAGAVPEPASWAMMIAGFGLVGATMRRRRQAVATA
jgi:hypothetical protein